MSKAEIVQRLLENNHITAEEAVVLLVENQVTQVTLPPYFPNSTKNPYEPPFNPTCNTKEK
jgi:hypothetical protein